MAFGTDRATRAIVCALLACLLAACATSSNHLPRPPPTKGRSIAEVYDRRPRAWCGWYMRSLMAADPGRSFNQALAWGGYGRPAAGPAIGVIVVWQRRCPHCGHVGIIVGRAPDGAWLIRSGNDSHTVKTRPRRVDNAVAFRWPP